jgi:hypothetical protein
MARVTRCRSRRFAAMPGRRRSSTRCRSRCSSRSAPGLACAQGKTLNCEISTWIQVRHPVPQPLLLPQPPACLRTEQRPDMLKGWSLGWALRKSTTCHEVA